MDRTTFEARFASKTNTLEDWVELLTSPYYRYQHLHGAENSRRAIAENLLCVIGTEWDYEDGYTVISHEHYVQQAYVDPTDPAVVADRLWWSTWTFPTSETPRTVYPICDFSHIVQLHNDPAAHPSYVQAAREICTDILEREATELPCNIVFAKKFLNV